MSTSLLYVVFVGILFPGRTCNFSCVIDLKSSIVVAVAGLPSVLHLLVWDGSDAGGGAITTPAAGGKIARLMMGS